MLPFRACVLISAWLLARTAAAVPFFDAFPTMRPRNMQGIYDPSGNGTASAGTAGTAGSSQTATLTSALALPTNGAEPSANSNQKPTVTVVTTPSSSATSSSSSSSSTIPAKPTAAPYKDQPGQCTFDLTQITGGNAVDPASSVTGNLTMADVSGTQIGKLDPTPYTMTTQANMSSLLENYLIIMSWVADNGNGFLGAQFVLGQATWNTDQTDTSKPQSCDNSSSFVSLNDHTGSRRDFKCKFNCPWGGGDATEWAVLRTPVST